jgi:hypothetical protein
MAQAHTHVVGVRAQCGCGLDGGGRAMRQERFAQFGGSLPVACSTRPDF